MRTYTLPHSYSKKLFYSENPYTEVIQSFISNERLAIEIGAGVGMHSIRFALENPQIFLISFERTKNRFASFQKRIITHGSPKNLCAIHGDAQHWISQFIPDESLEKIFLLYPNPYPKRKQMNLRWHYSPFMSDLIRKIQTNGEVELRTNMEYYFREFHEQMINSFKLKKSALQALDFENNQRKFAATHFENKYLAAGQTCYRGTWVKNLKN